MDAKHRKAYVGDTIGNIRVYNVNSGVLVKKITLSEDKNNFPGYISEEEIPPP